MESETSSDKIPDDMSVHDTSGSMQNLRLSGAYFTPEAESSKISDTAEESAPHPSGFEILEKILKSCTPDLSSYLEKCKMAMICNSSISTLTREDVNSLFHTEVGIRGIFFDALEKYRTVQVKSDAILGENGEKVDIEKKMNVKCLSSTEYRKFETWKKVVRVIAKNV